MSIDSSGTVKTSPVILETASSRSGLLWGLVGVLAFSLTVPLTRLAVDGGGLSPLFAATARAVIAAILAATALAVFKQPRPRGRQWLKLSVVAAGVVIGFPLLTSFALTTSSASHGAVVIAILPAATAVTAVWRTGERPRLRFWIASVLGAIFAVAFAIAQGGVASLQPSDLLLFGAVAAAAVGYAEGGLLARTLGAWQTISWALVIASPLMAVLAFIGASEGLHATAGAWSAFAYLAVVSMFLAFIAWYRGLAIGPMASVSQIQLAQPVFGLVWAAVLVGESLKWMTVLGAVSIIVCATLAVRSRA